MMAIIAVWKVCTFVYWQKSWKSIIKYVTKADLAQRTTSDDNKQFILTRNTAYCRKITFIYWSLMFTTDVIVVLQPIMKYFLYPSYRENVKNGTDTYLQIVSSWVPFDKNRMCGYLASSLFQSYATIYGAGWITSFDTNAVVIMVFFKTELELLRIDCGNIFGSENEQVSDEIASERLRNDHKRHVELLKYSTLFDSCLSPIMLPYVFVCSIMLCVTAYQITLETSAAQRFLQTEYLVFGVAQLFLYCWHSNDVLYASEDLRWGPYESTWWLRRVHCKDLFILVPQFSETVVFSAGPFTKLTVATFINILKGAYSYYTLLSQSQMK